VDEDVYSDTITLADQWINSGYLTVERFIVTYLANQYSDVTDFKVRNILFCLYLIDISLITGGCVRSKIPQRQQI
jgi:hypothetical protein